MLTETSLSLGVCGAILSTRREKIKQDKLKLEFASRERKKVGK